jgi:ketosteroid isomerase-like protein
MQTQNAGTATRQRTNAQIVARAYQAFNEADMNVLTEAFDERASWNTPGRSPAAGNRKGRDAVFAQFGRYGGETGGTFKAELKYVAEDDEGRVVGFHHNSGMRNGKRLDTDCCIVFELKDGRITSGTEHFFDLYNWDEFWS